MKPSAKEDGPTECPGDVTQLLLDWSNGDKEALAELMPLVYAELRRLAGGYLRREPRPHTLQATALVHEAYLQLIDQRNVRWQNRAHFFGIAATLMRRILVEHARRHQALKRGNAESKLSLDEAIGFSKESDVDLLALDDALTSLAAMDPQKSRIVELRFFGGLTVEETAEVLNVAPITIHRAWRIIKAWLRQQMDQGRRP
jgi:RNA polymerase sigma factor (TIGR02999 family)